MVTTPSLTVSSPGSLFGTTLEIDRAEMVIGRRPDCDLVLADEFVSRAHATIRTGSDGVSVEDLGSTGKTFVNGRVIASKTVLRDGDSVRFGEVETVFRTESRAGAPAGASGDRGDRDDRTARDLPLPIPAPGVAGPGAPARRSVLVDGSLVCLECGTKNPLATVFCTNPECGTFLEFAGAPPGGIPVPEPADPDAPTLGGEEEPALPEPAERPERRHVPEEARVGVAAVLTADSLTVEPGGYASCEVAVRNTGTIVDAVAVTVVGEAGPWASVEPERLSLMPGSEGVATITFRPPRDPGARAGEAPFEIRASSGDDPQTAALSYGILHVGAFHEMSVELVPSTSRGARTGVHRLTVRNGGNAPLAVDLVADDPDQLMQFAVSPSHLDIEPGTSANSRVQVRARKPLWWGPSKTLPLRVNARPDTGEPVRADGGFAQRPRFPKWFRKALLWPIGLATVAVMGLLLATKPWKADPKPVAVANCVSPPLDEAGCTQLLVNAGLTVQVRKTPSGTAKVGTIIATQPAAGSEVKKGSVVLLTISDGLKVPNDVVGRTEQDARKILTDLGFDVPRPAGTEEGGQKGLVVRTLPPPGSVLLAGETVQIFVSAGPTTTTSTRPTTTTTTTIPPTTTTTVAPTTTLAPTTTVAVTTTLGPTTTTT